MQQTVTEQALGKNYLFDAGVKSLIPEMGGCVYTLTPDARVSSPVCCLQKNALKLSACNAS